MDQTTVELTTIAFFAFSTGTTAFGALQAHSEKKVNTAKIFSVFAGCGAIVCGMHIDALSKEIHAEKEGKKATEQACGAGTLIHSNDASAPPTLVVQAPNP